jgi:hypothetical protein
MEVTGFLEILIYTCLTRVCHIIRERRYVSETHEKYMKRLVGKLEGTKFIHGSQSHDAEQHGRESRGIWNQQKTLLMRSRSNY